MTVPYVVDGVTCNGYLAYDETFPPKRFGVLLFHAWHGQDEFIREKTREMARGGLIAFAVDIFGEGKTGKTKKECEALIQPFLNDRALLEQRILGGLNALRQQSIVYKNRIGAIGFCFGGLCVLDLARSGADLKGVVSVHGLLLPRPFANNPIQAKILALHGHDDPLVPPAQVLEFQKEMTKAKADWQMHIFGLTSHAFTNPEAHDPAAGLQFQPASEARAWIEIHSFLKEVL